MQISTGIVTGRRTDKNREGTESVRLLIVQVSDDFDMQTVQLVGQTGEESNPPNGSHLALIEAGSGFQLAVGSVDAIPPVLGVGGKRIYSTDADGAAVMASIRLDPDGTVTVSNPGATITVTPAGIVTVAADGEIRLNGSKTVVNSDLDVAGTITAPNVVGTTDVTGGGKVLSTHIHSGVQTGGGNTGAPV
jgi:phage baseplate assembly protein V